MISSPPWFIGLRYAHSKRRHQFISFVSGFSFLGMALGTLSLIVVLSVMNGFDREIKQRILSVIPHGYMDKAPTMNDWQTLASQVESFPDVVATAPYIGGFVMLSTSSGMLGVEVQGVLPEEEQKVSRIEPYLLQGGTLDQLEPKAFSIILGRSTARYLRLGIGDALMMTLPQVSVTPAGIFPRVKRLTVNGIFEVGAPLDHSLALIHLDSAQRLFRYGSQVQGLRLQFTDIYHAQQATAKLKSHFGEDYEIKDWSQTQGSLFQAITLEKRMVTLLLMMVIAVAALNIVTSLVLMVSDKRSDIAVLRTLGMSTRQIMGVFMVQGGVVGIAGVIVGGVMGCVLAVNISSIVSWFESVAGLYVFDPSVYFISRIPSDLRASDVMLVCIVGTLLSILATLYPAYRASKVAPAEALSYE